MSGWYDVAQVCHNGHMINDSTKSSPAHNKKYCEKCGAATLTQCSCGAEIQGDYHVPGVVVVGGKARPPAYCHACGKAFPWTTERVAATIALLGLIEDLKQEDREALANSLPDLLSDGPRTQVASVRWKRFLGGGGKKIAESIRSVVTDARTPSPRRAEDRAFWWGDAFASQGPTQQAALRTPR